MFHIDSVFEFDQDEDIFPVYFDEVEQYTSPKGLAMQEKFLVFTHVMRLSCWCTKQ